MNREQALETIAGILELAGLTIEDLAEHASGPGGPAGGPGQTLRDFALRALDDLGERTQGSYRTHVTHLLNGVERQCPCTCSGCVGAFAETGTCACECPKCRKAKPFAPAGDLPLSATAMRSLDLGLLVKLVERMAVKRARLRNQTRAGRGLSPVPDLGQGAREMCVTALRWLFRRMVEQGVIHANPAAKLPKGRRSEPRRRALTDVELSELLAVVATGGDDPALDLALTWAEFELGARRQGIITLTVGALDRTRQVVRLVEKGNIAADQPCSGELIDHLLALAASRGGTRCVPGHRDYDPGAPVFYYKDTTPDRPHALTSRRFDALHVRVQRRLPWANAIAYTGHDLRHTLGSLVERTAGFETARHALRHAGTEVTSTYTKATTADVARAIARLTGSPHPLAGDE